VEAIPHICDVDKEYLCRAWKDGKRVRKRGHRENWGARMKKDAPSFEATQQVRELNEENKTKREPGDKK